MIHTYHMSMVNWNTYTYAVQVPKLYAHALKLDEANGDDLCQHSIAT